MQWPAVKLKAQKRYIPAPNSPESQPDFYAEAHSPTLPHILLRVINYAGKLLALRGKIAATIWRQPQFLLNLSHICSPAPTPRIHCNRRKSC
ncbi:hypothetical protein AMECASPLE_009469 [Ameca splendens]|uniref:Uncharacterized protein n=1 Tax=Ameca splendens TaxID=208324 RepID=A0ABV0XP96_9TELE